MFKCLLLYVTLVLCLLTSCGRDSSSRVDAKNDCAEIPHPLIDFLQGEWVLGAKQRLDKADSNEYILFEGAKLTFVRSKEDPLASTFKIMDSNNEIDNHFYVEFSYPNLLTEDDPFSEEEKGSIVTEIDAFKLIKHSCDCIEIDPERGKASSLFYYRKKQQ